MKKMIVAYFTGKGEDLEFQIENILGKVGPDISDEELKEKFPQLKAVLRYSVVENSDKKLYDAMKAQFSPLREDSNLETYIKEFPQEVALTSGPYVCDEDSDGSLAQNEDGDDLIDTLKRSVDAILVEPTFEEDVREYTQLDFTESGLFVEVQNYINPEEEKEHLPLMLWVKENA